MVSPNLFIVGPPRTGTTSLIEWLALHPDVARPSLKEPMFHAHDLASPQQVADVDEYLGLYADLGRAAYYIDATPWYMFSRQAAASIYEAVPDAHVIITLRNPVQVLSSLHARHVLVGLEPEPDFARAVLDGQREEDPIEFRRSLDYLAVGRFGEQTARFTDLFPPEQVHFVLMRDMAQRPRRMHLGLLEELGIAQLPLADYAAVSTKR